MFKYIQFHLFLKNSFVGGEATSMSYNDVQGHAPKTPEQKKDNKEDLSHLSPEAKEKVEALRKEFENLKLSKKFVGWMEEKLRTWLLKVGDPKDKEFWEIAQRIKKMQNELVAMWEKWAQLKQELSKLLGEVETEIRKISPEENKQLQTIDNKEFLNIPAEKRLQYVNKAHADSSEVSNGSVKSLEFTFNFDGKANQELYKYTTAWQVLPSEVRSVSSKWQTYERLGVNGEFYNKENKRLTIHEWTQINVEKLGSKEDVATLEKESNSKYDAFVKENPKYQNEQYTDSIKEMYNKGLSNDEVMLVLTFSYDKLSKLDKTQAERLLTVVRHLDNSGYLDDFTNTGWEMVKKLEEIKAILTKYAGKMKYNIESNGNIKFQMNDKWLPEWLDVEPSLEKFTQVALSQLGTTERDGWADKYLKWIGYSGLDSRNTPRCAAFVNWSLQMSGFKGTNSLAAKSFIEGDGYGHVGIKLWDKILWGNQSNQVSLMTINKPVAGYAIPTEKWLEVHKPAGDNSKIPDGAIIVFDREPKNKNFA